MSDICDLEINKLMLRQLCVILQKKEQVTVL